MVIGGTARTELAAPRPGETGSDPKVEELVEEFLTEQLGFAPGEVVPTGRFSADYGVDSLDLLELAVDAQERFGAEISDEALAKVVTVGDFGRCVSEAIARRERDPRGRSA
jgi:acyl carrier protein